MAGFRTPFADILGPLQNSQNFGKCRDFELHMYECLEAYGLPMGWSKCKLETEDYVECVTEKKQMERLKAMKNERWRQFVAGNRSYRDYYAEPPKIDSF